ncbi:MOSC domain-containing protein [Nocardioides panacisoli]|uniref:MOSC domain-containing protein n=1 Tax=Nocardioides panacisoli TaxID=627624 RepID=A0ABP7IJT5_9ACTN
MSGEVIGVHVSDRHAFSKQAADVITLLEGLGVEGDAHCGVTVQHRSRVRFNPAQPNLRQVHLIHAELFDHLAGRGFDVRPGDLGENITTRGLDLLDLPVGARLTIGDAVVTVTGLRNPCVQIDRFAPGLLKEVVHHDDDGRTVRLTGVMGVVSRSGTVRPGDDIVVELPSGRHYRLDKV